MRQNEDAREPLNALKAERSLTIEFLSAPLSASHQRRMTIFGLFQISSRTFDAALGVLRKTTDQLIFPIEKLRQRQLDVLGNALDFGSAFGTHFSKKPNECILIQPSARL